MKGGGGRFEYGERPVFGVDSGCVSSKRKDFLQRTSDFTVHEYSS